MFANMYVRPWQFVFNVLHLQRAWNSWFDARINFTDYYACACTYLVWSVGLGGGFLCLAFIISISRWLLLGNMTVNENWLRRFVKICFLPHSANDDTCFIYFIFHAYVKWMNEDDQDSHRKRIKILENRQHGKIVVGAANIGHL